MLRSIDELRGYKIQATDGEIGKVHDFYFDDKQWTIRYLVVDTGNWLSGRRVLISPLAIDQPDWESQIMPVLLTQDEVEESPTIDLEKPVSRQKEQKLFDYYGWTPYWSPSGVVAPRAPGYRPMTSVEGRGPATTSTQVPEDVAEKEIESYDPHLRSLREVTGYHIQARDGEVGHVDDLIADDVSWVIQYIVVDTRNWLPGRKVLVAPTWIEQVKWANQKVHVDLKRDTIKNSPEYDPSEPVNRDYEKVLYDYYGRPRYWEG